MSSSDVVWLGAIAGFTIFLGLPLGRVTTRLTTTKAALNAVAVGVLLFLLWDILAHAWDPIDTALTDHTYGTAVRDGIVLVAGLGTGLIGLVWFDRWMAARAKRATFGDATIDHTITEDELRAERVRSARRLALLIAV